MTTIAQKILEISVDSAAPATPIWKPKIRIAFPTIFIILEITEMVIGSLVFSCARNTEDPALKAAINGNERAVYRKYISELIITSASTFPKIRCNSGI